MQLGANFQHKKKKTQGEFITPPRPTGRRSNESLSETQTIAIDFSMTEPKAMVSHLRWNKIDLYSDTDIESQHSWL